MQHRCLKELQFGFLLWTVSPYLTKSDIYWTELIAKLPKEVYERSLETTRAKMLGDQAGELQLGLTRHKRKMADQYGKRTVVAQ